MQVTAQFHSPRCLLITAATEWIWTLEGKEESLPFDGNRTPDDQDRSLVTISTELSRVF